MDREYRDNLRIRAAEKEQLKRSRDPSKKEGPYKKRDKSNTVR